MTGCDVDDRINETLLSYLVRHPASNEVSDYFAYLLFLWSTVLLLVNLERYHMLDRPDSFPEHLNGGPPHSDKSECDPVLYVCDRIIGVQDKFEV